MLYVHHIHILVCRVFKWNYEQLLYGQTFLPTDIRFARANAPLINKSQTSLKYYLDLFFMSIDEKKSLTLKSIC